MSTPSIAVRRANAADRAVLARLLSARGLGIGRALLVAMARIAVEHHYCRIDWTTDGINKGAQRLYDRLGVPRHNKVFYRLSGDTLKKFATG